MWLVEPAPPARLLRSVKGGAESALEIRSIKKEVAKLARDILAEPKPKKRPRKRAKPKKAAAQGEPAPPLHAGPPSAP
jgi:hypothetical protein